MGRGSKEKSTCTWKIKTSNLINMIASKPKKCLFFNHDFLMHTRTQRSNRHRRGWFSVLDVKCPVSQNAAIEHGDMLLNSRPHMLFQHDLWNDPIEVLANCNTSQEIKPQRDLLRQLQETFNGKEYLEENGLSYSLIFSIFVHRTYSNSKTWQCQLLNEANEM